MTEPQSTQRRARKSPVCDLCERLKTSETKAPEQELDSCVSMICADLPKPKVWSKPLNVVL